MPPCHHAPMPPCHQAAIQQCNTATLLQWWRCQRSVQASSQQEKPGTSPVCECTLRYWWERRPPRQHRFPLIERYHHQVVQFPITDLQSGTRLYILVSMIRLPLSRPRVPPPWCTNVSALNSSCTASWHQGCSGSRCSAIHVKLANTPIITHR